MAIDDERIQITVDDAADDKPTAQQETAIDEEWIQNWIGRMDRGQRFEAITELRMTKEKEVVILNKEFGERFGQFRKMVMEIHAFIASESPPEDLIQRVANAKIQEEELKEFEKLVIRTQKEYEAFASMEREVNRMA